MGASGAGAFPVAAWMLRSVGALIEECLGPSSKGVQLWLTPAKPETIGLGTQTAGEY